MAPPPPAPTFRDRSTALVVVGVFVILLGALCFLSLGLGALSARLPRPAAAGPAPPMKLLLPSLMIYLAGGVFFAWTGVGLAMGRRWARALLSAVSRIWLGGGLFALGIGAWLLPRLLSQFPGPAGGPLAGSAGISGWVAGCALGCGGLAYVVLPLLLVVFCGGRNVRATVSWKDRTPRWTDGCPDRVLAVALMLAYSAAAVPLTFLWGVAHAFGHVLTGVSGVAFSLALAGVGGWLAVGVYRLRPTAWWGTLGLLAFGSVAWSGFFLDSEFLSRIYVAMGVDVSQGPMRSVLALFDGPAFGILGAAIAVCAAAYLLWIRRDFASPGDPAPRAEP